MDEAEQGERNRDWRVELLVYQSPRKGEPGKDHFED